MNIRGALHALADTHCLDADARRRLLALTGAHEEPAPLVRRVPLALAVLAAALVGLGVVMWIAANWETFGRMGRFALLMALVAAAGLGAALRPGARPALTLLAFLGIGALFAYFGQTYQTGADPWQLFALWAVLGLPLALGARSDVLWAPWSLVVVVGISLWVHAHLGHRWRVEPGDLAVHAWGWMAALVVVGALSAPLRRWTGAGPWGLRTAATLAVILVTTTALGGLFHEAVAPHYALGLLLLGAGAGLSALRCAFDVFVLSAAALGLNVLLVSGLSRVMFDGMRGDAVGVLLVIGLAMVALGVWLLLGRSLTLALPKFQRGGADGTYVSMYLFGVSYALASLTCTISPFLSVTTVAFRAGSYPSTVAVFAANGLGMGVIVGVLTVAVALAKAGLVARVRALVPVVNRVAGALLVAAGAYVAYYGWYSERVLDGYSGTDPVVDAAMAIQRRLRALLPSQDSAVWWTVAAGLALVGFAVWGWLRRPSVRPTPTGTARGS